MRTGETVLVHGAAGGVGTATLQVAKGLGARTIAVVSSPEKAEVARQAGADEVVMVEGLPAMASGVRNADAMTWAAVLWQSVGNTMFGYAAWGWLLSRHPAATVTPMALLVPVFGIGASALLLGEALPAWKLLAAVLVMSGLVVGLLWPRIAALRHFQ